MTNEKPTDENVELRKALISLRSRLIQGAIAVAECDNLDLEQLEKDMTWIMVIDSWISHCADPAERFEKLKESLPNARFQRRSQ